MRTSVEIIFTFCADTRTLILEHCGHEYVSILVLLFIRNNFIATECCNCLQFSFLTPFFLSLDIFVYYFHSIWIWYCGGGKVYVCKEHSGSLWFLFYLICRNKFWAIKKLSWAHLYIRLSFEATIWQIEQIFTHTLLTITLAAKWIQ